MPVGRGQPLPPRLQQQGDRPSFIRANNRTPPPRFGSQGGLFNSSGRPINKHWNNSGKIPAQHRQQMQDLEKKSMEESASLYELQERDPNAFPALPSVQDRNGGGPCSFWSQDKSHQGHQDGSGQDDSAFLSHDISGGASGMDSTVDTGVGCRADGISPTPPQPIPQIQRQVHHHPLTKAASPLGESPTVSTPPPLPPSPVSQPGLPPPLAPGIVQPAWSVPYYSFFVIPHMENLTGPVNYGARPSRDIMGNDLPLNDSTTLRFFYNLGVEYHRFHSAMVQMQNQQQYAAYCTQPAFHVTCYQPPPPTATLTQGRPPQVIQTGRLDQTGLMDDETNQVNGQCALRDSSPGRENKKIPSMSKKKSSLHHKKEEVSVNSQSSEEDGSNCSDCTHPGCSGSLNDSGCVSDTSVDISTQKNQDNDDSGKDDSDQFSQDRPDLSESSDNLSNHSDSFSQHSNVSSGSSNDIQPAFVNRPRRPAFIKKINGVTHRLLRPIKDIPPRFQRILSAETSKQHNWKLEGPPLVLPISSMSPVEYLGSPSAETSDSSQVSFNPNAQCFIPGQVYCSSSSNEAPAGQGYCNTATTAVTYTQPAASYLDCTGTGGSNATDSSSGVSANGNSNGNGSSSGNSSTPAQQHPPPVMAAPTYTIHLTGIPSNYPPAAYGDGNNYYFASSVPPFSSSSGGYYPTTPGSPDTGPVPQGTVYYSSEVYPSQQQFVPAFQPPVMYSTTPLQQGQYQHTQYPMSV